MNGFLSTLRLPKYSLVALFGGAIRIIGGIGLLKNLKWAMILSSISCVLAISAMFEMLPFGLMDAVLGSAALILILTGYFGKKKIFD